MNSRNELKGSQRDIDGAGTAVPLLTVRLAMVVLLSTGASAKAVPLVAPLAQRARRDSRAALAVARRIPCASANGFAAEPASTRAALILSRSERELLDRDSKS